MYGEQLLDDTWDEDDGTVRPTVMLLLTLK